MITLAPYQLDAHGFQMERARSILADRPGIGKTFPTLASLQASEGPRLVVVPAHLARS